MKNGNFIKTTATIIASVYGFISAIMDIWTISGTTVVLNKILFIISLVLLSSIVVAVLAYLKYRKIKINGTTYSIISYGTDRTKKLFYTKYSKNLRCGTLVTIYVKCQTTKIFGYGLVYNENPDEYNEIEILYIYEDVQDIYEQAKTNNPKIIKDMYVLPNTYVDNVSYIANIITKKGVEVCEK